MSQPLTCDYVEAYGRPQRKPSAEAVALVSGLLKAQRAFLLRAGSPSLDLDAMEAAEGRLLTYLKTLEDR